MLSFTRKMVEYFNFYYYLCKLEDLPYFMRIEARFFA